MTPHLPKFAAWLLRLTVPERWADSVTGDFESEWAARRRRTRRPRLAAARLTVESAAVALRFTIERLSLAAEATTGDVRLAARALVRRPAYAVAAIGVIALGVALNLTAFTIVHQVLLTPLPFADPAQLFELRARTPDGDTRTVSSVDVDLWADALHSAGAVAAYQIDRVALRTTAETLPAPIAVAYVTPNLFDVLGVNASMGRTFTMAEGTLGSAGTVVMAGHIWRARFPGSHSPIGALVDIDGRPHTLVGLVPSGLEFPPGVGVWVARQTSGPTLRDLRIEFASMQVVARLGQGLTATDVDRQGRAAAVAEGREASPVAVPLHEALVGPLASVLRLTWAGVAFLFLMACANAAGLLLSRMAARGHELQIRASLGASRLALIRHAAVEGTLLAAVGTAAGVALAAVLLRLFSLNGSRVPLADAVDLSALGVAFALGSILVAALTITLSAAVALARPAAPRWSMGGALVATQLAICVGLTVAAATIGAGLLDALRHDPGFDPDDVLVVSVVPDASVARRAATADTYRPLLDRIAALPGVTTVAMADHLPPAAYGRFTPVMLEGESPAAIADAPQSRIVGVTDGYFETLRLSMVAGRAITAAEMAQGAAVAVVDERTAARAGGHVAVGRRLIVNGRVLEIVGVAANAQSGDARTAPDPTVYLPLGTGAYASGVAAFLSELHLVVRTAPGARHVPAALLTAATNSADLIRVTGMTTMTGRLRTPLSAPAFYTAVFGSVAVLGGLLAALGVYGLVTHVVQRATRELGVRVALGASRLEVVALVGKRGLTFAATGLGLGLVAAPAIASLAAHRLEGAAEPGAALYLAVTAALLLVVSAGSAIPAWRATRVDPVRTLKCD